MSKRKISFEDLAKLAQVHRQPCERQAFSMSGAKDAARIRRGLHSFKTNQWWVVPCFDGCGRDIWHLTQNKPNNSKLKKINNNTKKGKTRRNIANRRRAEALAVGNWLDDGGAFNESD